MIQGRALFLDSMIVICPSCTGKFKLPDDKIKPDGTKVRCSKCGHTFKVYPEGTQPPAEAPASPPPPTGMDSGSDFDGFSGFDSDFAIDDAGHEPPAPPPPPARKPEPTPAGDDADFGNLDSEFGFGEDEAAAPPPPPPPPPPAPKSAPAGDDGMEFTTSDGSGVTDDDLFGGDDFGNRDIGKDEAGPGLDVEDAPAKPAPKEFDASDDEGEARRSRAQSKPKPAPKPAPKKPANKPGRRKEKGGVPWVVIPIVVFAAIIGGPIAWQKSKFPEKSISPGNYVESVMGLLGVSASGASEKPLMSISGTAMTKISHKSGVVLYYVTGDLTNVAEVPLSYLKTMVSGKLTSKGTPAGTAMAYPGNILGDSQLQSLPLEAIEEKMANKHGDNMVNLEVAPGASVPFMVVFTKVEGEPDSFELEISQQGD